MCVLLRGDSPSFANLASDLQRDVVDFLQLTSGALAGLADQVVRAVVLVTA